MQEYFRWSKVYCIAHEQGSYLLFTVEYGDGKHTGVMLPAVVDDIWNMAGSRVMDTICAEQSAAAASHEEVLRQFREWTAQNLKGRFSIDEVEAMIPPPLALEEDV